MPSDLWKRPTTKWKKTWRLYPQRRRKIYDTSRHARQFDVRNKWAVKILRVEHAISTCASSSGTEQKQEANKVPMVALDPVAFLRETSFAYERAAFPQTNSSRNIRLSLPLVEVIKIEAIWCLRKAKITLFSPGRCNVESTVRINRIRKLLLFWNSCKLECYF